MEFQFVLYGIELLPVVFGLSMLVQHFGLSEYWTEWFRALLMGGLGLLVLNQAAIAGQFPWFENAVKQGVTVLGIILTTKGVWPDARAMWNRATYRESAVGAEAVSDHNMRRF